MRSESNIQVIVIAKEFTQKDYTRKDTIVKNIIKQTKYQLNFIHTLAKGIKKKKNTEMH